MTDRAAVVVTSIHAWNDVMKALAEGCGQNGYEFIVVGDVKSPETFHLTGCDFFDLDAQIETGFEFAKRCPEGHYARKNVGYLIAIRNGANVLIETDDDNLPFPDFFAARTRWFQGPVIEKNGWTNVYRYFSDQSLWPRGLPLDAINVEMVPFNALPVRGCDCPIQQGLVDDNPDVDAIYRLILPLPQTFRGGRRLALGPRSWCPFNSQNTTWWRETFPLLYLPAYCSFRMTDIWRSFVAQRIAWANDWNISFHAATMRQERNEHNLMADFADEIPGYLHNRKIAAALERLPLAPGLASIPDNMRLCYRTFVDFDLVGEAELPLLEAWLVDLSALTPPDS